MAMVTNPYLGVLEEFDTANSGSQESKPFIVSYWARNSNFAYALIVKPLETAQGRGKAS